MAGIAITREMQVTGIRRVYDRKFEGQFVEAYSVDADASGVHLTWDIVGEKGKLAVGDAVTVRIEVEL